MEATRRLKAQGLRKGGKASKKGMGRLGRTPKGKGETKSNKTLTPQEKKDLLDKIKKSQGKMTNPFLKFNKLGQPYMEAKKGGSAKFPDLSGDGKVTMKDVLMGRGVIKKPKKKADGGSVFQEAIGEQRRKPSMTLKGGKLKGVKDAPEERAKERQAKTRKRLLGARSLMKGIGKAITAPLAGVGRAGAKAGRLAKRGYGIAKK